MDENLNEGHQNAALNLTIWRQEETGESHHCPKNQEQGGRNFPKKKVIILIWVLSVFGRGRGTVDAMLGSENSLCACAIVHPSIYSEGCTIAQHYHTKITNKP